MEGTGAEKQRRTLRLALAMRGGVSLAVWIGGAVAEIDVLRRRGAEPPRPAEGARPEDQDVISRQRGHAYQQLLELCGYGAVEVDVLAGASAGGLNSVLYATALTRGTTIDHLDRVWVGIGGLWRILRGHRFLDREVSSLLAGDGYFAPELHRALRSLAHREHAPELVATNVSVDLSATVLDAGAAEEANARDGRGHIHLDRRPAPALGPATENPMTDLPDLAALRDPQPADRTLETFAYAGRTTSSFPYAFEPAQVRSTSPPFAATGSRGDSAPVEMSRWFGAHRPAGAGESEVPPYHVVDGGVLDNIPVDRALRAIQAMPAGGPTHRTLLFLDPDPASPTTPPNAFGGAVAVVRRVTTIRGRGEKLSDELDAIRTHNEREGAIDGRFAVLASGAQLEVPGPEEYARIRDRADARWALELLRAPAQAQLRSPYDALAVPALGIEVDETRVAAAFADGTARASRSHDVVALADATALLIDWTRRLQDRARPKDGDRLAAIKRHLYRVRLLCRVFRQRQERGFLACYWSFPDGTPAADLAATRLRAAVATLGGAPSDRATAAATIVQNGVMNEEDVLVEVGRYVASGDAVDPRATALLWESLERRRQELADLTPDLRDDPDLVAGRLHGYAVLAVDGEGTDLPTIVSAFTAADAVPATSALVDVHVVGGNAAVPDPSRFPLLVAAARRDWIEETLRGDEPRADDRVAPSAAELLTASTKLAGNSAANFSGFLAARWRRNDWWWGRRDAAITLVDVLVAAAATPPTSAQLDAVTAELVSAPEPDRLDHGDPDRALDRLRRAVADSVERELAAGPGGGQPVTEGAERFRNLRPVYLTGLATRAADLTWQALMNGVRAVPSRWGRGAARTALTVGRPLVVLAPLAVNAVRAMVLAAAVFATAGLLGGLGGPGEDRPFLWTSAAIAVAALAVVAGLVRRVRVRQDARWGLFDLGGTDAGEAEAWQDAYGSFRERALSRATWMTLGGVATVLVPLVAVPAFPGATRPAAGGVVALLALVWCVTAYRAATTGPAERTVGWSERDRRCRYLGIALAVALALVALVDTTPLLPPGLGVGLAVGLLAAGGTATVAGGWARWEIVLISSVLVGAGTGMVARAPVPIGLVALAWLVLVSLASFCWAENDQVDAQEDEEELMRAGAPRNVIP
ncbi:patatin-like protein [Actinomycetospora sp. C-140]